jgi:hypothetical protein
MGGARPFLLRFWLITSCISVLCNGGNQGGWVYIGSGSARA